MLRKEGQARGAKWSLVDEAAPASMGPIPVVVPAPERPTPSTEPTDVTTTFAACELEEIERVVGDDEVSDWIAEIALTVARAEPPFEPPGYRAVNQGLDVAPDGTMAVRFELERDRLTLAACLQTLRRERGLSQKQAADLSGVSDRTIRHWELDQVFPMEPKLQGYVEALEGDVRRILALRRREEIGRLAEGRLDLEPLQALVLTTVVDEPEHRVRTLAERLDVGRSAVQQRVASLRGRGLLQAARGTSWQAPLAPTLAGLYVVDGWRGDLGRWKKGDRR